MLGGVEVIIGGTSAPLNYVGPFQINFVVPYGAALSTLTEPVSFVVRVSGLVTYEGTINLVAASPDFFKAGGDAAAALNQDSSVNSAENPAAPGSIVQFFATGHGPLAVTPADGAAPGDAASTTTGVVEVFVQQSEATVEFSGLAPSFAALWQINVRLPTDLAITGEGTVAVFVKVDGLGSEPVAIYVQN